MNQINKILSGLKKRKTNAALGEQPVGAAQARTKFVAGLVNQFSKVLSMLRKPRAKAPASEPSAAVAHAPKNRTTKVLIGALVFGVACAAGGLWWNARQKVAAPAKVASAPAKPIPAPHPISAPVAMQADASGGKVLQATAASKPVAEVVQKSLPSEIKSGKEGAPKGVAPGVPPPLKESTPKESTPKESTPKESTPKESTPKESTSKESAPRESAPRESRQEKKNVAPSSEHEPALSSPAPADARAKPHAVAGRKKHDKPALPPVPDTENMASGGESNAVSAAEGSVDKQVKPLTAQQQANNEFIKSNGLVQQGRIKEALDGYEAALQLDPGHEAARQSMVVLLLEGKRNTDAERVLQDGLKQNIKNSGFAMLLARIQLDRDAAWSALLTLQKTLPYAKQQADYQAFIAALLQRLNRHKEAVLHYQTAVELTPDSGVWWMGLGISLRALQRTEESRVAFRRALESHTLNADLRTFVTRQLKEL